MIEVERVRTPEQWKVLHELIQEYATTLGFSLEFQHLEDELSRLPEVYGHPAGAAFLASDNEGYCGCVAFKELETGVCEMKRLYVRESCRGQHAGRLLAETVMVEARTAGFRVMRLDTLQSLRAAVRLYKNLGFYDIPPYNNNPRADVRHLERML